MKYLPKCCCSRSQSGWNSARCQGRLKVRFHGWMIVFCSSCLPLLFICRCLHQVNSSALWTFSPNFKIGLACAPFALSAALCGWRCRSVTSCYADSDCQTVVFDREGNLQRRSWLTCVRERERHKGEDVGVSFQGQWTERQRLVESQWFSKPYICMFIRVYCLIAAWVFSLFLDLFACCQLMTRC